MYLFHTLYLIFSLCHKLNTSKIYWNLQFHPQGDEVYAKNFPIVFAKHWGCQCQKVSEQKIRNAMEANQPNDSQSWKNERKPNKKTTKKMEANQPNDLQSWKNEKKQTKEMEANQPNDSQSWKKGHKAQEHKKNQECSINAPKTL